MRGEFNFFMDVDGKGCDSLKLEACPFRQDGAHFLYKILTPWRRRLAPVPELHPTRRIRKPGAVPCFLQLLALLTGASRRGRSRSTRI